MMVVAGDQISDHAVAVIIIADPWNGIIEIN